MRKTSLTQQSLDMWLLKQYRDEPHVIFAWLHKDGSTRHTAVVPAYMEAALTHGLDYLKTQKILGFERLLYKVTITIKGGVYVQR